MTGILAWMLPAGSQAQSLGLYPTAAPSADADRLSDAEELTLGTNSSLADTDGDLITDSDELLITGTNPLLSDSDMDGLTDYEEWVVLIPRLWDVDKNGMLDIDPMGVHPPLTQDDESPFSDVWWANAHQTDYDGDGISDRDEILYGNFSRYDYMNTDTGNDDLHDDQLWGQPDHWEPTDYDRDGLSAATEAFLQTDPNNPDTDGDGLRDGLDFHFADPLLVDTDANGISDHDDLMYYGYAGPHFVDEAALESWLQYWLGSSPLGPLDWDRDGMSNVWEIAHGLNPVDPLDAYDDPDGDFLFNIEEYQVRSNPHALLSTAAQAVTIDAINPTTQLMETRTVVNDYEAVMGVPVPAGLVRDNGPISGYEYDDDWDGDGYGNRDEMLAVPVRNPRFNELQDTDGDGLTDIWETLKGLDKNDADEDADSLSDGADDFDNDGLTNLGEQAANTNPLLADTDGDSLPDGWEVTKGLNPLNPDEDGDNLTDDADNFDIDLLTNAQELAAGTHPRYSDTDADGLRDDWELANQLNPLSSAGIHGGSGDADGDGFSNAAEQTAGSSPQSAGSTPPATFIFKSWSIRAAGSADNPNNIEVKISGNGAVSTTTPFPNPAPGDVVAVLNTAADWAETHMKAQDYANASITPWTSYNPALTPGWDLRHVGVTTLPVAVKADFTWHDHTFQADYRRVRLEVAQAVGAEETRSYLVFTETEGASSFQAVGTVTFTLAVGQTMADVALSSGLAVHGMSKASDGKTLLIEPSIPDLTATSASIVKRNVYLLAVAFITPAGDPVTAPVDAGKIPGSIPDGANEFTFTAPDPFSSVPPHTLTLKLKVKISGFSYLQSDEKAKFKFGIDTIGNSTFNWDNANSSGVPTVTGDLLTAVATYTNLPTNNSDFGLKHTRIKYDAVTVGEASFEVFYPRDANNHPGTNSGIDPNWFYYWGQVTGGADLAYGGAHTTLGGIYDYDGSEGHLDKCIIYDRVVQRGNSLGPKGVAGMDCFGQIVTHERMHHAQFHASGYPVINGIIIHTPSQDTDLDWLSNSYETTNGFDPTKIDTDGDGVEDREEEALAAEYNWPNDSQKDKDWANPGKNKKP